MCIIQKKKQICKPLKTLNREITPAPRGYEPISRAILATVFFRGSLAQLLIARVS